MIKNLVLGAVLPIMLVSAGVGLFMGLQAPPPPQAALPQPVKEELLPFLPIADVAQVRALSELSECLDISVSGTVVPFRELTVAAEVQGRIVFKDPSVRSGNYVSKGQTLFRVDPRDYELELERLERRHAQELASITELQQEIENTRELLAVAEQQLKLRETEVARFEGMKSNFSSAAELDQARGSLLTSMNQRVTLQNQLRAAQTRRSRFELAAELAETEISKAKLNLQRTEVIAPVSGRVVVDSVEADSYVQSGTQLLVIEDTEKVEVACNVRMDQLYWLLDQPALSADRLLNAAQATRMELPDTPVEVRFRVAGRGETQYTWAGELDRYDGAGLDPQSRTVPIRVRIDNPDQYVASDGQEVSAAGPPLLVRGLFVDVVVKAQPSTPLLLVPKLSIKPASNSNVIWKFSPDAEAVFESDVAKKVAERSPDAGAKVAVSAEERGVRTVDPAVWETGFLTIVDQVQMVTAYWETGDVEYWVCEVGSTDLAPGDYVITTPLPGIKADGNDPVRVRAGELGDLPAAEVTSGVDQASTTEPKPLQAKLVAAKQGEQQ